jgi:hypothetical protein
MRRAPSALLSESPRSHVCAPVLRSLTAEAVKLPIKRPLGTSARRIDEACLLLVVFAFLQHNAKGSAAFFGVPARQVVEFGTEIEI